MLIQLYRMTDAFVLALGIHRVRVFVCLFVLFVCVCVCLFVRVGAFHVLFWGGTFSSARLASCWFVFTLISSLSFFFVSLFVDVIAFAVYVLFFLLACLSSLFWLFPSHAC